MEARLLAWTATLCAAAVAWPAMRDRYREAVAYHRYRVDLRRWQQCPLEQYIPADLLRSVLDVTRP